MIFALNHLLILVITPLLFHYRDVFLSVPVLGKISLGSQWISWSSDTAFIFCFKMTDERRQTLKQSGSQTARCLVRIMFANLKKGMKNKKKAIRIISLRRGTGSSVNSSCVIYPITAMCVPPSPPPLLCFSISSVSAHMDCCYHLFFSKGERGGWTCSFSCLESWCRYSSGNQLTVRAGYLLNTEITHCEHTYTSIFQVVCGYKRLIG